MFTTPTKSCTTSKKENIGLIEVMGLAVLPARLKDELAELGEVLAANGNPPRAYGPGKAR